MILALTFATSVLGACAAPHGPAEQPKPEPAQQIAQPRNDEAVRIAAAVKEVKENAVESFNAAFSENSDWESAVRGTDGGPICRFRERHNAIQLALGYIEKSYSTELSWEDVSVPQAEARLKAKEAAEKYAKEIDRVMGLSLEKRQEMGTCGSGEGTMELVDTSALTEDLIDALKSFGGSPQDIGSSPEKLRSRLLTDYVKRIGEAREKRAKNSDEGGPRYLILEATSRWGFSQQQLGVTDAELAEAQGR